MVDIHNFDWLCDSPAFAQNLSRNTRFSEVLTPCISYAFGGSVPLMFTLGTLPYLLVYSRLTLHPQLKCSKLFVYKVLLTVTILLISAFNVLITSSIATENYLLREYRYGAICDTLTSIGLTILQCICFKSGIVSSGCVAIIWLLRLFASTAQIALWIVGANGNQSLLLGVAIASFTVSLQALISHCFADKLDRGYKKISEDENRCPELTSSFLRRHTYWFMNRLLWNGFRRELDYSDFWSINDRDATESISGTFDRLLLRSQKKYAAVRSKWLDSSRDPNEKPKPSSVFILLLRTTWKLTTAAILFSLFEALLYGVAPFIVGQIVKSVVANWPFWLAAWTTLLLFVTRLANDLVTVAEERYTWNSYSNVKTVLTNAIYQKMIRLSAASRATVSAGEVISLISVDVQRIKCFWYEIVKMYYCPSVILVGSISVYQVLGMSAFVGLFCMCFCIPISAFLFKVESYNEKKQMETKDERLKLMNEVLNGIKVIKFHAWEPSMEKIIAEFRQKEMVHLRKIHLVNSLCYESLFHSAAYLASISSFMWYILYEDKQLTPQVAFVALSIFEYMKQSFIDLPQTISRSVTAAISLKRVTNFLHLDELEAKQSVKLSPNSAVLFTDYSATWDSPETKTPRLQLENINLKITKGELIAVVGRIGSGKSTLLNAIFGEMNTVSGRCEYSGSIAYAPQEPWIQNKILRENILFDRPLNKDFYQRTLYACALGPDLNHLPASDLTQIGEKGVNLSGGQKARVSLARAVYRKADLYLLDDPLSAVDSHVGRHIFENVFRKVLKGSTQILVTHSLGLLKDVDRIIFMEDGKIAECGTFEELTTANGKFASFNREYLIQKIEESSESSSESSENDLANGKSLADSTPELQQKPSKIHKTKSSRDDQYMRDETSIATLIAAKHDETEIPEAGKLIEEEKVASGRASIHNYLDYIRAFGICRAVVYVLFLFVFSSGTNTAGGLWLASWSDDSKYVGGNVTAPFTTNQRLSVYALLGLLKVLCIVVSGVFLAAGAYAASVQTHNALVHSLFRAPMSFFDATPLGRILNRVSGDIEKVDGTFPGELSFVLVLIAEAVMILLTLTFALPILLIPMLFMLAIFIVLFLFYTRTTVQTSRLASKASSFVCSFIQDAYSGASSIRSYNVADSFHAKICKLIDWNVAIDFNSILCNRWIQIRTDFVTDVFVFIFVFVSVYFGYRDIISAGLVGLIVSQGITFSGYLGWIARVSTNVEQDVVAIERINEYIDAKQEAQWYLPTIKYLGVWPSSGKIEFRNLSMRYTPKGQQVLKNVSLKIKGGEKISVVGRTGAGKSSLTIALCRIVEPDQGTLFIDDVDICLLGLHDLRNALTIIPQDPVLFSGTLRMNLDPFKKFTDDQLWSALEKANAKQFVASLDLQLDHHISEAGGNISVGQRQLLCLARALLRKTTKILILDEATAAVDEETDSLIQKSVRENFAKCTILTIAHRLNTVMHSDRIVVLHSGRIQECGTPRELLLDENSSFYAMVTSAGLI